MLEFHPMKQHNFKEWTYKENQSIENGEEHSRPLERLHSQVWRITTQK